MYGLHYQVLLSFSPPGTFKLQYHVADSLLYKMTVTQLILFGQNVYGYVYENNGTSSESGTNRQSSDVQPGTGSESGTNRQSSDVQPGTGSESGTNRQSSDVQPGTGSESGTNRQSFATPPEAVQVVCECVAIIKGLKEINWKTAKGMMADPYFLRSLMELNVDAITGTQIRAIRAHMREVHRYLMDPNITMDSVIDINDEIMFLNYKDV
uniref:(California timema) hypothetical protein n=1 Tax=Timema californicum TaxID=61474 RepID=A0A7R9J7K6_TIMCA|nr:unnamed protein product [Timema californicum]